MEDPGLAPSSSSRAYSLPRPLAAWSGLISGFTLFQVIIGFAAMLPVWVLEIAAYAFGIRGQGLVVPAALGTVVGAFVCFWIGRGLARLRRYSWTLAVAPASFAVLFAVIAVRNWDFSDLFGSFLLVPLAMGSAVFAVAFILETRHMGSRQESSALVEQAHPADAQAVD